MTYQELALAMADKVKGYVRADRAALEQRLAVAEAQLASLDRRVQDDALVKDVGLLRERVAVVEVRQLVPGPAGVDGKAGADGLGWDDLLVEHDGERGFTVKMSRGEQTKTVGAFTIPAMLYRGVWDAKSYEPGDVVTWAGSSWHCTKGTATKPDSFEGAGFWKLMVKRGDPGRAAK